MVVQHTAAGRLGRTGMSRWLRVCGLNAWIALAACTPLSERTQVRISVDADTALRPRIQRVDVELRLGADVDADRVTRVEHLTAAGASWPLRLLVTQADPADHRYQLSAYARGADGHAIAVARASSAFVDGRTLELGLHFDAECADRSEDCPAQTSCQAGKCESAFVPPETLPGSAQDPVRAAAAAGGSPEPGGGGNCAGGACLAATSCTDNGGCDALRSCSLRDGHAACGPCPDGFVSDPNGQSCAPVPLALNVEGASLVPAFSPEITEYRVRMPLRSEQLHLSVNAAPGVQLSIDGRALASAERWDTAAPSFGDQRSVTLSLKLDGHGSRQLRLLLERAGDALGYLKASNADAGDELGRVIAASGNTLVVGAPFEDGSVRSTAREPDDMTKDAGAAYVFVRDASGALRQEAYLKADAPHENAQFGISVAIDGDRIVVGASGDGPGAAYVFERQNGAWSRVKVLSPDAQGGGTQKFGAAVAIVGDTLAIGASTETSAVTESGAVYMYERGNGDYAKVTKLKAKQPGPLDWLGSTITLSQDVMVGAATGEIPQGVASSGVLHVFTRGAMGWQETQTLPAPDPTACAFFGAMVVVSGDTLAATCWNASAERPAGAVYLYQRGADGQFQKGSVLSAAAAQSGDQFGHGIALQGDTLLVGAPAERSAATGIGGRETGTLDQSGAAYLFTRQGDVWHEQVRIKAPKPFAQDGLGNSVALGDDYVLYVAASQDGSSSSGVDALPERRGAAASGAVHVFR